MPCFVAVCLCAHRFMLKQINDKELAMFLDAAPAYFEYLSKVPSPHLLIHSPTESLAPRIKPWLARCLSIRRFYYMKRLS